MCFNLLILILISVARQAGYGDSAPASAPVSNAGGAGGYGGASSGAVGGGASSQGGSSGGSCSCGVGAAGPPGPPGADGNNGNDGAPGADGDHGSDAPAGQQPSAADFCFDCPPGRFKCAVNLTNPIFLRTTRTSWKRNNF